MSGPGAPFSTRFAPSPTGPLHFGSLVAALGSWIEARHHGGTWHVRIDDLDPPREEPGAADAILRILEAHGLGWDGEVVYQSRRGAAYQAALERLRGAGLAYPCACSRRETQAAARRHGAIGAVYPGTCRDGLPAGREERAVRVRTDGARIRFTDGAAGGITTELEAEVGDFVIRRADGFFAYHLACAVDDAAFGYSHVIRGQDLLVCTPPQIHLQRLLGLPTPIYHHLPLAFNEHGQKLSKQNRAPPLSEDRAAANLVEALGLLGYSAPERLRRAAPAEVLAWTLAARAGSEPLA
ncbi:tRNA glutamyl-Q(34) synthetase GluQRS [Halorhodospira halophila]|uniref:tRNA glutamyl-Q(34) synthetase GluQRS n=1 Tax=Halorhodospira halophila TaxID=1053 RepID=UPI001912CA7F|nr:tRNA glutamyl-Q(34) synthetase GluQRS [Halorhodospira halophila]MBK5944203.1 tRNA glutamyl-Q(34) synthetase GluQRS [Halorhodospira halophila]